MREGSEAKGSVKRVVSKGKEGRVCLKDSFPFRFEIDASGIQTERSEGGEAPAKSAPDFKDSSPARKIELLPRMDDKDLPDIFVVRQCQRLQRAYAVFAKRDVIGR